MKDIRWKQRYSNFTNMVGVLKRNFLDVPLENLDEIHLIGLSKSFELSHELMWKLFKDYLEYKEVKVEIKAPVHILRMIASVGILENIADGDILMKAHQCRNELVHVYDAKGFLKHLEEVKAVFLPEMLKVDAFFGGLADAHE